VQSVVEGLPVRSCLRLRGHDIHLAPTHTQGFVSAELKISRFKKTTEQALLQLRGRFRAIGVAGRLGMQSNIEERIWSQTFFIPKRSRSDSFGITFQPYMSLYGECAPAKMPEVIVTDDGQLCCNLFFIGGSSNSAEIIHPG